MKLSKSFMENTAHPRYDECAREVEQFEAEYGKDWESTVIEYDKDFVSLPKYVAVAADFRTVLQWLHKGNIKERVNAKSEDGGSVSLLLFAATRNQPDLMSYLLLNGADVNILESLGGSVLTVVTCANGNHSQAARLLLSWGAEFFVDGKQKTKELKMDTCDEISRSGNVAVAKLMSSELGGRRCEIVSTTNTCSD